MKWLNKLFNSDNENKSSTNSEPKFAPHSNLNTQSFSSVDSFEGLDYDFLNLLYYENDDQKQRLIQKISATLNDLDIKQGMSFVDVKKIFTSSTIADEEIQEIFMDALLFNRYIVITESRNGIVETRKEKSNDKISGLDKINNYYTALGFSQINLHRKLKAKHFDFQFEKKLIYDALSTSDLFNYASIDTLFQLGVAYLEAADLKEMDRTFEKLASYKYDLADITVSNFYRSIGEIYIGLKEKEKALHWLNEGLKLNPKLGVKKAISDLSKS